MSYLSQLTAILGFYPSLEVFRAKLEGALSNLV